MKASIQINTDSNKIKISPLIYGNFIEHLGNCIHNGIWTYDKVEVPLVNNNERLIGVRKDVLLAAKELKISVLRAFGGCYSDVYHWKDAIGPRNSRKVVKNKYWNTGIRKFIRGLGPKIQNQFGTDEFLNFCEEIGAKPYLNVNYGTGTPEEAADWVEYCNGSIETEWGKKRAENGRTKPYNVPYWGIANEIFGWWEKGYEKHPENYAKKYLKFAKVMKAKDPNIKLIACGCQKPGWNQTLLKLLGEKWVDFLSIHLYIPADWRSLFRRKHPEKEKIYYSLMAAPKIFEELIKATWEDIISALGEKTHVRIAFDEWGIWYKFSDVIKTNFNIQDGICAALILMAIQRESDKCTMANWAQLINCLGTIQTRGNYFWKTPVYYALKMIAKYSQNFLIRGIKIESPNFNSKKYGNIPKMNNIPYISCNATINDNNKILNLILVNKHFSEAISTDINIKNFNFSKKIQSIELISESAFDYNTESEPEKIKIKERFLEELNSNISLKLPPHSLTILKFEAK
ncbi:MAG: alpha-L-arabinofuranosidase C-terminal domain-containing protein [Promethearchaeota archaeon]